MSGEPVESGVYVPWQPDAMRQRLADYTLEDVLNLPPDAPRVELADGVMVVVPSPTIDHQDICSLVWSWMRRHAPKEYRPVQAVGVAVDVDQTYEPDIVVVSRGTRRRDRLVKPAEYAAVGIPFYWRVEQGPVHVFAYGLSASGTYELVADTTELLELAEPFPISLPISEITP